MPMSQSISTRLWDAKNIGLLIIIIMDWTLLIQ
jgi:hypothetical protein